MKNCFVQIVFSNESAFEILADKTGSYQLIPVRTWQATRTAQARINCGHRKAFIMVYCRKGTNRLQIIQGTIKQDQYKTVLQTTLIPQLRECFSNGERFIYVKWCSISFCKIHKGVPCQ